MKRISVACTGAILAALVALHSGSANAATFSYHGSLDDAGKPAEGSYDLELTLYSASSAGRVIGGPIVMYAVPVHAGSFSTQADFGPLTQGAGNAWVAVKVRNAGANEFVALADRAAVAADAAASVCPGAWTLDGNAGTTAGNYLGTADAQPLVIRTGGQPAMTISAPSTSSLNTNDTGTNIIAGYSGNSAATGNIGVTIAGGGGVFSSMGFPNSASGDFATIGGGVDNQATDYATVSGGVGNAARFYSAVGGGNLNNASAANTYIGGGLNNVAAQNFSVITGGLSNETDGYESTVAGGQHNIAGGDNSFAAGFYAQVRSAADIGGSDTLGDHGTFIWADDSLGSSSSTPFTSTGPDQFLVRAAGGVGINTAPVNNSVELTIADPANGNDVGSIFLRQHSSAAGILFGSLAASTSSSNDATLTIDRFNGSTLANSMRIDGNGAFTIFSSSAVKPLGGSWAAPSDARLKRDVQPLANTLDRVLQLHGVSFEYAQPDHYLHPAGRHIGFIAQQVQRVFPDWVGSTPDGYLTVSPQGFEAMTVEALRDLRAEKDAEIAQLTEDNAVLHTQLDDLVARVAELALKQGR